MPKHPKSLYRGSKRRHRLREVLSFVRLTRSMTQQQVASALGFQQTFVSKYELDERQLSVIELLEVCRVLELDPHAVIDELLKVRE